MSYSQLRPLLFRLPPETAHELALRALGLLQGIPQLCRSVRQRLTVTDRRLRQEIWGLEFGNPVGMAAGFDKNGGVATAIAALGFGFVEVGTVTPRPQPGNPRPRVFRFADQETLQNALGFNNSGMEAMRKRLKARRPAGVPLGINIGKNKVTPVEAAAEDYVALFGGLADSCDYFVVNVSSPNTPGLRSLQEVTSVQGIVRKGRELSSRPILVKLAPDLEDHEAVELACAAVDAGAAGIVLTNTTTDYSLVPGAARVGGLSGRVLKNRSFELLERVAAELFGRCLLVSVGGVDSAEEAYRRLRAGASLLQIYTALVFQGPALVRDINRGLVALMAREGAKSLEEVIGADR
ncbi:MAG: quinone-dependent dihydroorotate dehydrogenase [Acidobacteria bacterium]|nr:MAG: quinone-dependent dihydroorotate dehydrogenase [Acidobacteriota bacterium]